MGFVDKVLTDLRKRGVWLDAEQAKIVNKFMLEGYQHYSAGIPAEEYDVLVRFTRRCQEFE